MNRKTVGREQWGYHSCQIPGQSGHFVWEKDLALSRLGSHLSVSLPHPPDPPSERSSRQRNETSRESAAAVWKCCYSKATLYFSIMLKFDMVLWVFRGLCVLWLIGPLDTFRFIHNPPHDFSCQQSQHNTISYKSRRAHCLEIRDFHLAAIWDTESEEDHFITPSTALVKDSGPAMTCRDDKYVKPSIR